MNRLAAVWALSMAPIAAWPQTKLDLRNQTKTVDFSHASSTMPVKVGTALPSGCSAGSMFFNSANSPGSNLYTCDSNSNWTLVGSSGTSNGVSYAVDAGLANAYVANVPSVTTYTDGLQVVFLPQNSNSGASTLSVSGLPPVWIKTQQGQDLMTPGTIHTGAPANVVYSGAANMFILLDPSVVTQQAIAAGPGLLTDFTQNPPVIMPDPLAICSRTQTCMPTGGQDLSNAAFLILPKLASDPATCVTGQTYYNTTTNTGRSCSGTNIWASLGSGNGTGGTQGPMGPQGPAGIQGPSGPSGQGYTWRCGWLTTASYLPYDTVSYNGSSWVAVAPNSGTAPGTDNGIQWNLMAQQGAAGLNGSGSTGVSRSFVAYKATLTTPVNCDGTVQTLDSYTMPANTLQAGDVVDVFAEFKKGGTTSGNNFTVVWPGSTTPVCCIGTGATDGEGFTVDLHYVVASTTTQVVGGLIHRANGSFYSARNYTSDGTADITTAFTVSAKQQCSTGDTGAMYQWWIRVSR